MLGNYKLPYNSVLKIEIGFIPRSFKNKNKTRSFILKEFVLSSFFNEMN